MARVEWEDPGPDEIPAPGGDVSLRDARAALTEIVGRAQYAGGVTYLTRHGTRVAAIVPAFAARTVEQVNAVHAARLAQSDFEDRRRADVIAEFMRQHKVPVMNAVKVVTAFQESGSADAAALLQLHAAKVYNLLMFAYEMKWIEERPQKPAR